MPMVCPKCHSPLPPGSAFCENCGARVNAAQNRPQNRGGRPNRRRSSGGGKVVVIIIVIVLALLFVAGMAVGGVFLYRVVKKGKGGTGKVGSAAKLTAGEIYHAGDIDLSMEDALIWKKGENFVSPGFKYGQIWLHMENTSDEEVDALSDKCFYIQYDGELPQWMKDWQTVYGKDALKSAFGADNRANIIGDVTEGEASFDEDYYDDPFTIAPGETEIRYLLYQIPEDAQEVTILYFNSEEDAKADKKPAAVFTLNVDQEREEIPEQDAHHYEDPAAAAAEMSTYKRPDNGDLSSWMGHFQYENNIAEAVKNNGKVIVQPEALCGGWIVEINDHNNDLERYLNGDLQISADGSAVLTLDWYQCFDRNEKTYTDESGLPNTVYTGAFRQNGAMTLSDGTDVIEIYAFAHYNSDIQTAQGFFDPNGRSEGYRQTFYMVRPDRRMREFMDDSFIEELERNVCYSDLDPQHRNTQPLNSDETPTEETTPTEASEAETTEPATEQTPPEDQDSAGQDGGLNDAGFPAISTFEHPTIDELKWVANAADAGAPPGATYLDFGDACKGAWKCRLYYNESTTQLVNVVIDGSDEIYVNIIWYLLWYNGEEPINEENTDNATFTGYQWGNGITATGDGKFEIDYFYQIGEYQYAVGTFTTPSGETATVGMIRP